MKVYVVTWHPCDEEPAEPTAIFLSRDAAAADAASDKGCAVEEMELDVSAIVDHLRSRSAGWVRQTEYGTGWSDGLSAAAELVEEWGQP